MQTCIWFRWCRLTGSSLAGWLTDGYRLCSPDKPVLCSDTIRPLFQYLVLHCHIRRQYLYEALRFGGIYYCHIWFPSVSFHLGPTVAMQVILSIWCLVSVCFLLQAKEPWQKCPLLSVLSNSIFQKPTSNLCLSIAVVFPTFKWMYHYCKRSQ